MSWSWFRFAPFTALIALLAALAVLVGVWQLGELTRSGIAGQDRYAVAFGTIDCMPPEPLTRAEFLDEVQYLAGLPDRLRFLDPDLGTKLSQAFARHPWVEQVRAVHIAPGGVVAVALTYRIPVLIVHDLAPGGSDAPLVWEPTAGIVRRGARVAAGNVIDINGFVLPHRSYPVGRIGADYYTPKPIKAVGDHWDDAGVLLAARTASIRPVLSGPVSTVR